MKVGLSRRETLAIPFSELLDLIAIEQIKHEGATLGKTKTEASEERDFWALMNRA